MYDNLLTMIKLDTKKRANDSKNENHKIETQMKYSLLLNNKNIHQHNFLPW